MANYCDIEAFEAEETSKREKENSQHSQLNMMLCCNYKYQWHICILIVLIFGLILQLLHVCNNYGICLAEAAGIFTCVYMVGLCFLYCAVIVQFMGIV